MTGSYFSDKFNTFIFQFDFLHRSAASSIMLFLFFALQYCFLVDFLNVSKI